MKKLLISLISFIFISFSFCAQATVSQKTNSEIKILHFNDYHSQVLPFKVNFNDKAQAAGLSRLIALIKKEKTPNSLVLVGGDILQGSVYSTIFKGKVSFSLLNDSIDYMVFGNHEFDYGQDSLKELIKIAKFKLFSSNVFYSNGQPFSQETYFIREINGIKIGIFGLTTTETPVTTHPKNVIGLKFNNDIETAKNMLKILKAQGAEIIICITHIGFEEDVKLANQIDGIDIIVGGHSHTKLENGFRVKNTLITQAYHSGIFLGKILLNFDYRTKKIVNSIPSLIKINPSFPQDDEINKKINDYQKQLDGKLQEIIGRTNINLDGRREVVRSKESNLGNLISDIIKDRAKVEIALINGGSIRASISMGNIKVNDILNVLPFNNTVTVMNLSGKDLIKIFERSASKINDDGGFLQFSKGIKLIIKNNKLFSVTYNNQPIIPTKMYKIVTSDFLAIGGDNYIEFKNGKGAYEVGNTLSDMVIDYIKNIKIINPILENRIVRIK